MTEQQTWTGRSAGAAPNYPRLLSFATEPARAALEVMAFGASLPLLLSSAPQGDGHTVLVLPGFGGSDLYTAGLRRYLCAIGYNARPWQLGRNTGNRDLMDRLGRRFHRLVRKADHPVSIVGHSLGGVFARELARQYPDDVRQVITLGSPIQMGRGSSANPLVYKLFRRSSNIGERELGEHVRRQWSNPPPVPSTAIFSRFDGIVHWRSCREPESEQTENIEVPASHMGMTAHPAILYVLADRLAQPHKGWERFQQPGSWRELLFG